MVKMKQPLPSVGSTMMSQPEILPQRIGSPAAEAGAVPVAARLATTAATAASFNILMKSPSGKPRQTPGAGSPVERRFTESARDLRQAAAGTLGHAKTARQSRKAESSVLERGAL